MKSWSDALREGFTPPAIDFRMSLSEAVSVTTAAVAEHLRSSKVVRQFLAYVPKGAGTLCPDSPLDELVKYVAIQRGEVDKSDPSLNLAFHRTFIMPVFDFERENVLEAVRSINAITPTELEMFRYAAALGRAHDALWASWFEEVAVPYQMLNAEGKKQYEALAKNHLAAYDYTVPMFDVPGGYCFDREAWAEAFPVEVTRICELLEEMAGLAIEPTLKVYFEKLLIAYAMPIVDRLEQCWADVDRAWVNIPTTCRIMPMHGIESGYEHPFGVSPEFRLEIRTAESRDVIEACRTAAVQHAHAIGLSDTLVDVAKHRLGLTDIGIFVTAIRAGVSLNFRYAGQAAPNRQEVLTHGGRIFVDKAASTLACKPLIQLVEDHCTKDTAAALKPFITAENQTLHTIIHEFAHPIGRTSEIDTALGSEGRSLLEEAKATLLGTATEEWRDSTLEKRLTLVALTVARVIRFMRKAILENPTVAPYVRENLVAATTLFDSGVLRLVEDGIEVDIEKAKGSAWFDELRQFDRSVLDAYDAHDMDILQVLAEEYCDAESQPVASLIAWVNRK